jgi:putative N6-adenine-specific DNA methylase
MNNEFKMVAKTLYGLEDVLATELIALGANNIEIGRRMVSFEGDKKLLYKANFHLRTALRILKPISSFTAKSSDEVYEQIKKIDWKKYLGGKKTFAVDAVVNSETFTHSKFVAYRTKDAIMDFFEEQQEEKPSVRVTNPDIQLHIHISHKDCTVSLDSSGESLHKRGYREDQTEAPLNEVLAAGMLLKAGWKGQCNFVDPMCGSGTLLIEAALIALNIAPGIYRDKFAFEKWDDFNEELFQMISEDDSNEREFNYKIYGSDISPKAISIASKNVKRAGLNKYIELEIKSMQQYTQVPEKGIMVTNPPYGERLNPRDLMDLYTMMGERMKHVFQGYDIWIITSNQEGLDSIGLKPSAKIKLINGALECEFRKYEIFSGKHKTFKTEKVEKIEKQKLELKKK